MTVSNHNEIISKVYEKAKELDFEIVNLEMENRI